MHSPKKQKRRKEFASRWPFTKNHVNVNFMKIRPVEAQLLHADGRTDRQNMTRLIVAFRNFANAY